MIQISLQIYAYARSFAVREGSTFPVLKIFARYLERKLECDTIEEEARAKNVSLVEIEEERMLRGGRRRRRSKLDKKPELKQDAEKGRTSICITYHFNVDPASFLCADEKNKFEVKI